MFDWGNWLIETVIAAFFISGFVIFYNSRLIILWHLGTKEWLNDHVATTLFVYVMVLFCLAATYWNPNNAAAYLNWALYILFIPLMDEDIAPLEFVVRVIGIIGFWFYTNSVRAGQFLLSLIAIAVILAVMYRYHDSIHKHRLLNMEVATFIGVAFWITQTQLTLIANLMGTVMFVLMNLFTNLYWSSERLATLERNRLEKQVNSDALTKAGSFFAFKEASALALADAQKNQTPLTLVMFDIDHFKAVNDTYGHAAGNAVLTGVAAQVQAAVNDNPALDARLYRTGGEEFNLIFPAARSTVLPVMQAIHRQIRTTSFNYEGQTIHVTLSMGITILNQGDLSFEDVYERADANLYLSKRNGRDCITVDGQQLAF